MDINYIRKKLKDKKLSWWGQRGHDALGLHMLADLSFIVCCDWGSDIKSIWGDRAMSLEKLEEKRRDYSNEDINRLLEADTGNGINDLLRSGSECLMYRSLSELEKITRTNSSVRILSSPVRLKNTFDNKILFREKLETMGINPIPGEIVFLKDMDYSKSASRWGASFVIKYPVSSSGKKTHLVGNAETFEYLKTVYPGEPVIIEKLLSGYSLNINAVVGELSCRKAGLSLQVIGIPSLTPDSFGFCGNDFSAVTNIPVDIRKMAISQTDKIAHWMRIWGFRGIMGIDFIVEDNTVYPVEINPRFQNSTSLLTLLEIRDDHTPLLMYHLAEFLGAGSDTDGISEMSIPDLAGSQVILHNLEKSSVSVCSNEGHGIFSSDAESLVKIREGYSIMECSSYDEFAVCSGVPFEGSMLLPGAPVVKIHFNRSVFQDDLKSLDPEIELVVKKIYNKFIKNSDG